jgi:hypothetical protein
MTYTALFDGEVYPPVKRKKRKKSKKRKPVKQTVLWTIYHSILVIELGMIVVIEFIELMKDMT